MKNQENKQPENIKQFAERPATADSIAGMSPADHKADEKVIVNKEAGEKTKEVDLDKEGKTL